MKFVIAGDYAEYYDFLRRKHFPSFTTEYIFISDPMRLYGRGDIRIISVGRYWKSPVYQHHSSNKQITFVDEEGKQISASSR